MQIVGFRHGETSSSAIMGLGSIERQGCRAEWHSRFVA